MVRLSMTTGNTSVNANRNKIWYVSIQKFSFSTFFGLIFGRHRLPVYRLSVMTELLLFFSLKVARYLEI